MKFMIERTNGEPVTQDDHSSIRTERNGKNNTVMIATMEIGNTIDLLAFYDEINKPLVIGRSPWNSGMPTIAIVEPQFGSDLDNQRVLDQVKLKIYEGLDAARGKALQIKDGQSTHVLQLLNTVLLNGNGNSLEGEQYLQYLCGAEKDHFGDQRYILKFRFQDTLSKSVQELCNRIYDEVSKMP